MRAACLAILLALPAWADDAPRIVVHEPVHVVYPDGVRFIVPAESVILSPAEARMLNARASETHRERVRLAEENHVLRQEAGKGLSLQAALLLLGVGALAGFTGGYLIAR